MKSALHGQAGIERLVLEGNHPAEYRLPGGIKWDDRDIQIVFASKLPVKLAGKRRVGVEVQILFEIDRHAIGRTLKRPPQVRVKPESADP